MDAQKVGDALRMELESSLKKEVLMPLANDLDVSGLDNQDGSEVYDSRELYSHSPSNEAIRQAEAAISAYAARVSEDTVKAVNMMDSANNIVKSLRTELEARLADSPFEISGVRKLAGDVVRRGLGDAEMSVEKDIKKGEVVVEKGQTDLFSFADSGFEESFSV